MQTFDDESPEMNLYIDADSLFDTRLTLLSLVHPEIARRMVTSGKYVRRERDEFEYCTERVFAHMYKTRTVEMLRHTRVTKMVHLVAEYVEGVMKASMQNAHMPEVKVYVNMYPYEITAKEVEFVQRTLLPIMPQAEDIVVFYEEKISAQWLASNVTMMIMYDGIRWVNENVSNGELIANQMLDSVLVVPRIMPRSFGHVSKATYDHIEDESKLLLKIRFMDVIEFSYGLNEKGEAGATSEYEEEPDEDGGEFMDKSMGIGTPTSANPDHNPVYNHVKEMYKKKMEEREME